MGMLVEEYVSLVVERQIRQATLSRGKTAPWGDKKHLSDLEKRLADAAYWRDKYPKGSEKRAHYRNVYNSIKKELNSAKKTQIREKQRSKNRKKLSEGGASGHMRHVSEDFSLTFKEIKEIISTAAEGKLEKVSEKIDGMNLVFTYDVSTSELRVARTGSDIKKGGMDAAALSAKFSDRQNLERAFSEAFEVLDSAMTSLAREEAIDVFGERGNKWYSMEVVYASMPNTINYDKNSIVFHGSPIFEVAPDGSVSQTSDDHGVDVLTSKIGAMQKSIAREDWLVLGPALVAMKKMSDGTAVSQAIAKIDSVMSSAGVSDDDTVYDYLKSVLSFRIKDIDLPPDVEDAVLDRAATVPGAKGVPELKKLVKDPGQKADIAKFVASSEAAVKRAIEPIESAIIDFSVEVLRGIDSVLISNSKGEVERLRKQVSKAISTIESSGNEIAIQVLQKELPRLGSVEQISSPMEGIVFFYKGKAYKFTAKFQSFHQILSLFKYGRKGVPPMSMGEVTLRSLYAKTLSEGGHAFTDVEPIALEDFKKTWPNIVKDLTSIGFEQIEPIGSTGKKPLMGDVDLAASSSMSRDEMFDAASTKFGANNVSKVGGNIVTISYPVPSSVKRVQVDVMIGKPSYLKWSRFGTSTVPSHEDFSRVKGVARNILLAAVLNAVSEKKLSASTGLDRTRFTLDFDNGLFKTTQTKRNKSGGKPLSSWKTTGREFVTDDPDEIASFVLGNGASAKDMKTLEGTVSAVKKSPELRDNARKIFDEFYEGAKKFLSTKPGAFGGASDEEVLEYLQSVLA